MSKDEGLQEALNDSMDASDPPAIKHPAGNDPVPSSGFPEEDEADREGKATDGNWPPDA